MTFEDDSSDENAITVWMKAVEDGDETAASELWSYCFPRLLNYSKKKLPDHLRRALDEEDVALSTFKSFCLAAVKGNFPELQGRDDLWKLLLCIAGRKVQAHVKHELRKKRGGGKVAGESIFSSEDALDGRTGIDQVPGDLESPDRLVQFTEDARTLIDMLANDSVKTVALLRMEGYSVDEIAQRMECGKRTIERRLTLIRKTWSEALEQSEKENSQES